MRKILGLTFDDAGSNSATWYSYASSFNIAAKLLYESAPEENRFSYYYNAGISLELIIKAITLVNSQEFGENHKLKELAIKAGLNFTQDQECTLELMSEIIIWKGRYPRPKKEGQWDNYYDAILEKHIVRIDF